MPWTRGDNGVGEDNWTKREAEGRSFCKSDENDKKQQEQKMWKKLQSP